MSKINLISLIFTILILFSYVHSDEVEISHEVTRLIIDSQMESPPKDLYKVWHFVHRKAYDYNTEEGIKKYKTFKINLDKVKKHNSNKENRYMMGLNDFSDLTFEEFKLQLKIKEINVDKIDKEIDKFNKENAKKFNLDDYNEDDETKLNEVKKVKKESDKMKLALDTPNLTYSSIDWRPKMLGVRNQGSCGSCWAFATMAMLEGNWWIKHQAIAGSVNEYLSTQQLVDCNSDSNGCDGGWIDNSIEYFFGKNAVLEKNYPYKAMDGTCKYNGTGKALNIFLYYKATSFDANYNLLKNGPLAVYTSVGDEFKNYASGIFFL